jgi:peptide/nickel transport system substrate-binding protein
MRRFGLAVVGAMLVGLFSQQAAAAAGSPPPPFGQRLTNSSYPARFEPGQAGGSVVVGALIQPANFNPYLTSPEVVDATQRGLVTLTDDLRYLPAEAREVPSVDNGQIKAAAAGGATIEWRLQTGLRWSDGKPLTCDDYRFTLAWLLALPSDVASINGAYRGSDGKPNLSVTCTSATDMVWHFRQATSKWLTLLPVPLPQHYLASISEQQSAHGVGYRPSEISDAPVSGPFTFVSATADQLAMQRNPRFRDPLSHRSAYLDRLSIRWFSTSDALIAAERAHTVDVATNLGSEDIPGLVHDRRLIVAADPQVDRLTPNWATGRCSDLQASRGGACPLSERAFREAIAYAIDRDQINAAVFGGHGSMTENFLLNNEWFASLPAARGYDRSRANAILDAAGFAMGPDGWRFRDFNDDGREDGADYAARIAVCARDDRPDRLAALEVIKAQLARVGIDLRIEAVPWTVLFGSWSDTSADTNCNLAHGTFDLADYDFYWAINDASQFQFYYASDQFEPHGFNDARVSSLQIDKAVGLAAHSVDADAIYRAMRKFQRRFGAETVEIPLFFDQRVALVRPLENNVTMNVGTSILWNAQHWWQGH